MTTASVFIVDDDPAVRDSLTLMIAQEGIPVQTFANAKDFLAGCSAETFGCAIIDIRMPAMSGLQLQEALAKQSILLPIIFLSGHGDIPMSVRAIKAGALDFLTKPVTRLKLVASVRAAFAECERVFSVAASLQLARSLISNLTEREHDVMTLAVQGYANKEIARFLGISHRTVEIHKSKIMHKTGAINLLDLARIAQEGNLVK
jgi:FixJ family two-component response regulator